MGKIRDLRYKYKGKRIYILGNGPSLRKIDVSLLKDKFTFSFNRAYIAYDNWGFAPTFYSSVDKVVLPDNSSEINKMIQNKETFGSTLFFFPEWAKKIIKNDKNVHFIKESNKGLRFFENIEDSFSILGNVAATSIQIAVYMGFKEIVLVGIDANYIEKPKSTQEVDNKIYNVSWKVYEGKEDNDPNHFLPNYFGKGKRYSIPNAHIHRYGWREVKDWVKIFNDLNPQDKIYIVDTALEGKLKIFPKVNFYEVLEKKSLRDYSLKKRKIVIWGTGEAARRFLLKESFNYDVLLFVDNKKNKWKTTFLGKNVESPKILKDITSKIELVVIAVENGIQILRHQLEELGVFDKSVCYKEL